MKKLAFVVLVFFFTNYVFSGPTDDQIRAYARELGVPFNDLKQLVEKYNRSGASTFNDPRARNAEVIDILEAEFLQSSSKGKVGVFYRINRSNCEFYSQSGSNVTLSTISGTPQNLSVRTDNLLRIQRSTPVDVLLEYRRDNRFYLVEIIQ